MITDDQGDHVPFLFFFLVNIRPVEPIGIVYLVDFLSGLRSLDARICQGHWGNSLGQKRLLPPLLPQKNVSCNGSNRENMSAFEHGKRAKEELP